MKRFAWLIVIAAMMALAGTLMAARVTNEIAPFRHPVWLPPSDALGDLLFTYDAESATGSNLLLGVEYVAGNFYVTSAGVGQTPPHKVYVLDAAGNLVTSFNQNTAGQWGWRDLAWDGQYLYASADDSIEAFTTSGTVVDSFTGPQNPNRALAYDPDTDHFWTANFASAIYEFDRNGTVVHQFNNTYSIYGMAWDTISEGGPFLWVFEQDNNIIRQFNPTSGTYTGVTLTNIPGQGAEKAAGGLAFTDEWEAKASAILVGLMQATPDVVFGLEILESVWPTAKAYYTNDPPTIDGEAAAGEWDDAYVLNVTGGGLDFTVYLMDDAEHLYGLLVVPAGADADSPTMMITFDNDNNDSWPTTCVPGTNAEGMYQIALADKAVVTSYNTMWLNVDVPTICETLTPTGLTAAGSGTGDLTFEFAIDLTAGEMAGALGETIGVTFYVNDAAKASETWPVGASTTDPADFGDLEYVGCAGCFIADYCWGIGEVNPDNECEICAGLDSWSNRDGYVCGDDAVFCNGDEVCSGGTCSGHSGDPCTSDGTFCNGEESCDETGDQCVSSGNPCPDDGVFCNGTESCGELLDICNHSGNPCEANETCNEDTDTCDPIADDDDNNDDNDDNDTSPADDDTTDDDDDDDNDTEPPADDDDNDDSGCGC